LTYFSLPTYQVAQGTTLASHWANTSATLPCLDKVVLATLHVDENEHVGYNPHPSWLCLIMGLSYLATQHNLAASVAGRLFWVSRQLLLADSPKM
jgi:hypothetical protein